MTSFSLLEKGMRQSRMNHDVKVWNQRSQYELTVFNIFRDREKEMSVYGMYIKIHMHKVLLSFLSTRAQEQ